MVSITAAYSRSLVYNFIAHPHPQYISTPVLLTHLPNLLNQMSNLILMPTIHTMKLLPPHNLPTPRISEITDIIPMTTPHTVEMAPVFPGRTHRVVAMTVRVTATIIILARGAERIDTAALIRVTRVIVLAIIVSITTGGGAVVVIVPTARVTVTGEVAAFNFVAAFVAVAVGEGGGTAAGVGGVAAVGSIAAVMVACCVAGTVV